MKKLRLSIFVPPLGLLCCLVLTVGCSPPTQPVGPKAPLPVSVITLQTSSPRSTREVTGSVASWKTEQIGFEVAGRVLWVLEPGEEVEGRVFDQEGSVVVQGTALAQVDGERYQSALEGATAQFQVAELQKESVEVSLNVGIPADLEAAKAELELAQVEYDRNALLVTRAATAQAELDQSKARLRTAKASVSQLNAREKQTQAELNSAIASIKQAEQSVKDAQRNVDDTTLYSSFRGQVAEVHTVPGSVVGQGTPVLTVQMMNPIKVEVEVSAEQSRTIRKRHHVPVVVTMPDGTTSEQNGFVYMVDPTADASTRTFTLTLLLLNEKIEEPIPEQYADANVARAEDLWRMDFDFLPEAAPGDYYIDSKAIRKDDQGDFVWKCQNCNVGDPVPEVLEVTKMRITRTGRQVPFLGNWTFEAVTVSDGESFDPANDFFVGELITTTGTADEWDGNQILMTHGKDWMLRPGDLVTVDLSESNGDSGFYVPMESIYEESGKTYVFIVDNDATKRIEVHVTSNGGVGAGTERRIDPVSDSELTDGMQLVVGGVHFLQDCQSVRVSDAK